MAVSAELHQALAPYIFTAVSLLVDLIAIEIFWLAAEGGLFRGRPRSVEPTPPERRRGISSRIPRVAGGSWGGEFATAVPSVSPQ